MIRLSQLIGQTAVELPSAEQKGKVKGIVLDRNRISAVQVDDVTIDASAVRSFEGDVLTYDSTVTRTEKAGTNPIGRLVLDLNGDGMGTIKDLLVAADGTVETVELETGDQLSGAQLQVIGTFAAIIAPDFAPPSGPPVA